MSGGAAGRWRAELEAWAIPEDILAEAPESPWGFPVELWQAGDDLILDTPSRRRALEAVPPGGSVLDVGCGGGRAGLSVAAGAAAAAGAGPAAPLSVVGVDESAEMLEAFESKARQMGVPHRSVVGRWPAVAPDVEPADVVVCHHVLYNVQDPVPFLEALASHAGRRVVVELTEAHPLVALGPLWRRFHGLDRPDGPVADLLDEVLRESGVAASTERYTLPPRPMDRAHWVAFTRRRLCLPASRDPEIDAVLGAGPLTREVVTFWWDT